MVFSAALALLCAAVCALIPWLIGRLRTGVFVVALGGVIVIAVVGALYVAAPLPLTDAVVWLIALSGGLLLGRALAPRFWPIAILLFTLSGLDIFQIALTSGGPSSGSTAVPPALYYVNFRVLSPLFPHGRFNIGIVDLLLLTALAEGWRRAGASLLMAIATGVMGLLLAYVFVGLTGISPLPLIPFITTGWIMGVAWRHTTRARGVSPGEKAASI